MPLNALLGTALPIIQAPMAGVQDSRLAIAVSNAGGLGSLPCAMLTLEGLHQQLSTIRAATDKPYSVNFFSHQPPTPDPAREQLWRDTLGCYYQEYEINPASIPAGPGRQPFTAEAAEVLAEFKPPIVSFHFGLPEQALLDRVKSWGAKVFSTATTLDEALWLEANGVDAIIAQGLEAGGHRGMFLTEDISTQVGTFALLPQVLEAVKVPVIAAGGIASAKGVAAAMSLGAAAVQIGTAYMLCAEATTSAIHREVLKSSDAGHTALTNLFSGRPARGVMNRVMREIGPMNNSTAPFPLATAAIAPLRSAAEAQGSGDFSPLWAGQNVSGCEEISAAEMTQRLAGMLG